MIVTPNTLPPQVQQHFDDVLLAVNTPRLIHNLAAEEKELPAKSGNTLRMSRYDRLPTFEVPLASNEFAGSTPPSVPLSRVDIDATISYYGQYVAINQQVSLNNRDAVLNATAELLGLSLRMTEDKLTRDMLQSTASVYNCEGGTNGDSPSDISLTDIDEVSTMLLTNNAWMITDKQIGEDRFGTAPVRDAYVAMCHTRLTKDLNALNGFIPKWNYPASNQSVSAEWGAVNNVRFMASSEGSITKNASLFGNDVYNVFICGLESYAVVGQDNYSSRFLYRPPVFSDPLFQNVTLGVVFAQVPRILNDLWIFNMRCTLR